MFIYYFFCTQAIYRYSHVYRILSSSCNRTVSCRIISDVCKCPLVYLLSAELFVVPSLALKFAKNIVYFCHKSTLFIYFFSIYWASTNSTIKIWLLRINSILIERLQNPSTSFLLWITIGIRTINLYHSSVYRLNFQNTPLLHCVKEFNAHNQFLYLQHALPFKKLSLHSSLSFR